MNFLFVNRQSNDREAIKIKTLLSLANLKIMCPVKPVKIAFKTVIEIILPQNILRGYFL